MSEQSSRHRLTSSAIRMALVCGAWGLSARLGYACDSCKAAVASQNGSLADGLNTSILVMLSMVFAIPVGFAWLMWRSFRSEQERRERGEIITTPGALRWTLSESGR